jgi:3-oxoacyl-[acyl-carrier-protein] synthase III
MYPVSLRSTAVSFPNRVMHNDHWRTNHPLMVSDVSAHVSNRVWRESETASHFERAMQAYLRDPFMGAQERRWLRPGELIVEHEEEAARRCLEAAGRSVGDVDLAIVSSVFPDQADVGNAAHLAKRMGLRAAINLESMCGSGVVGMTTAAAFIASGHAKRVLVVSSCSYSRVVEENDPLCWANGDGASCVMMERADDGGVLASHIESSFRTNGAMLTNPELIKDGTIAMRMRPQPGAGKLIGDQTEPLLRAVLDGVTGQARSIESIDHFATPAPMAWMDDFIIAAFGIPATKLRTAHARYANTGPVMTPTHLHLALQERRIMAGMQVCLVAIGSTSNAAAMVLRIGDVAVAT